MRFNRMMRRGLAIALSVTMLGAGALAEAENAAEAAPTYDIIYSESNPVPAIAAAVRPAVVQITTKREYWNAETRESSVDPTGYGSATYIRASADGEGGYLLTNYHVVQDGDTFSALWLDGTETELDLIGYDDGSDIALMRFKDPAPEGVEPVPLGDSDALQVGELAICIGNPGAGEEVLFGTVTAGIISGLQREGVNANNFSHRVDVIQTDAPINSGCSGGALLNAKGEMVGIPTLKMGMSFTTVYEGLGFCIPISAVRGYIDQIIDNGNVVRPRMGVTVVTIDGPEEAMRRYPPIGAQVYTVEKGAPADKAGLKVNDVITEANGQRVRSSTDLVREVDKCAAGESIKLKVYRYNYDAEGNVSSGFEELEFEIELEMLD